MQMTPSRSSDRATEQRGEADEAAMEQLQEGAWCTSAHTGTIEKLQLLMKVSQLRLVNGTPDVPNLKNSLKIFPSSYFSTSSQSAPKNNSETPAADDRGARGAKTLLLGTLLVRNYVLLKLIILVAILSRRDYLRGHIKLSLQQNATIADDRSCVLKEDMRLLGDNLARFEEHEQLTSWIRFLGVSFLSVPGLAAVMTGMCGSLSIVLIAATVIYLRLRRVRADHLCFIFDPVGERHRVEHELEATVKNLTSILTNLGSAASRGCNSSSRLSCAHHNERPMARDRQQSRMNRAQFIRTLAHVNQLQLVRPYNVTGEWHAKLVCLAGRLMWVFLVVTYITSALLVICLLVHDLYETARFRVAELACRRWNPNGTQMSMLDQTHLRPMDTEALEVAYGSHDGSVVSLLRLALTVEAGSYFSFRRVAFILELHIGATLSCLWGSLAGVMYLTGLLNKIVWLGQLEKEITSAAKESAEHAERSADDPGQRLVDSESRLLKTLTAGYLHYELFRRQEHVFHEFISFCLWRFLAVVLAGISIAYVMAFNGKTLNHIVLLYLYVLVLPCVNSFLLAASYKAKQVERIKCKVAQIVAHCASSRPLQMSCALELWRRQLLYDHVEPDLLGMHISNGSIVSFNARMMAAFLITIRVISYNN